MKHYECDRCGLCCRWLLVKATWLDVLREPRIAQERPNKASLSLPVLQQSWVLNVDRESSMACAFLGEGNACGIYTTRPTECVAFMPGSSKCQELRSDHGLASLPPAGEAAAVTQQIVAELVEAGDDEEEW